MTVNPSSDPITTSRLYSSWIAWRALWATLGTSMQALYAYGRGRLGRQTVNALLHAWSCYMLQLVRVQLSVTGREHVEQAMTQNRPCMLFCNHVSLYDIPFVYAAFPDWTIRMMGKRELFRIPLFGTAIRAAEFVPVDRRSRAHAQSALQLAQQYLSQGIVLCVFPEGTRSRTGKLQALKQGVFQLAMDNNAYIIPVVLRGSEQVLPARCTRFKLGVDAHVQCLPAIDTSSAQYPNRLALVRAVQTAFLSVLDPHSLQAEKQENPCKL